MALLIAVGEQRMALAEPSGLKSTALRADIVRNAKTVLWNGPMGVSEIDASAVSTAAIANALVEATAKGAITIVGGCGSVAAVEKAGLESKVSHVSTGAALRSNSSKARLCRVSRR